MIEFKKFTFLRFLDEKIQKSKSNDLTKQTKKSWIWKLIGY